MVSSSLYAGMIAVNEGYFLSLAFGFSGSPANKTNSQKMERNIRKKYAPIRIVSLTSIMVGHFLQLLSLSRFLFLWQFLRSLPLFVLGGIPTLQNFLGRREAESVHSSGGRAALGPPAGLFLSVG